MTHRELKAAEDRHLKETMRRTGLSSLARKALDRGLKEQERILAMRHSELNLIGEDEAAAYITTALESIAEARHELGKTQDRREAA